jgi:hypothetical protein
MPECTEPIWHIRISIGNDIVVGANSGAPGCYRIQAFSESAAEPTASLKWH